MPDFLKPIENIGQPDPIEKRNSEEIEYHFHNYFTLPMIPSVRQFCHESEVGEYERKQLLKFLKKHPSLQKLLNQSKT